MNQDITSQWYEQWENRSFSISLITGHQQVVRGEVLGPWGIHESTIGIYDLTHLISGRRVVWGRDHEAVRSIAEELPLEPWLASEPLGDVRSAVKDLADRRGLRYRDR